MLRASSRSYVCWRCATNRVGLGRPNPALRSTALDSAKGLRTVSFTRSLATVQHPAGDQKVTARGSSSSSPNKNKDEKLPPIRERLRKWEEENPDEAHSMLTDFAQDGELSNTFTRPQNVAMAQIDISGPLYEGDELSDLRSDDVMLQPGDLVEMSSEGSRRPMLAICLGRINGYEHYYTDSGKWLCGVGVRTLFVVNKYVEPEMLEPIIAAIPTGDIPLEALNALQDLGHGPSRSVGAPLLRAMLDFTRNAEKVYQANASTLDASSSFIGDPLQHRYLTLHEIADLLLPLSLKVNGKFSPSALYAVHRSLLQDEVFFRPLKQTGHRKSYLFEISPLSEVRIVSRIEAISREYHEKHSSRRSDAVVGGASVLSRFIQTAQRAIDESRKSREFSRHGLIGPSKSPSPPSPQWTQTDLEILQFIEMWACYQKFPSYSRLQCIGSSILRALDRYDEDTYLGPVTGWTFLQEIGWIPPWEIPARYSVRFPDVGLRRGGGFVRPHYGLLDKHLKTDVFEGRRQQFEGNVYCIDAESTVDIDDGISIEGTSNPEQYWIHVHIADPASSIPADTPLAKYAELVPETIYLPGHYDRMLPGNVGHEIFSLGQDRRCLTFSALVNDQGTVLDMKITPKMLKNVVYMTGDDVNETLGETRIDPTTSDQMLTIGSRPEKKSPERKMTRPKEVTQEQKDELSLLSKLGKAIQGERLKRGATPFFQARAEPHIFFDEVQQTEAANGSIRVMGDPSIEIKYGAQTGTDIVENIMRLAGEVAARWCHERGIPIPYRTQPLAHRNAEQIQQYTRDVFYPIVASGGHPDSNQWRHLRALLGGDEISTTPGSHFTLGVDMYTKSTSPLRRFSDLIVHWQIEAALLREMESGKSLVGNQDDEFLPYSRERLDRMLPMLRVREKQARALQRGDGTNQWILQALVRAWRFGEGRDQVPDTFRLTVEHVGGRRSITGRIDWFDRQATVRADLLNGVTRMADVRIGDVLEVRLKDVNIPGNLVLCEAVRLLHRKQSQPPVDSLSRITTTTEVPEHEGRDTAVLG